MEQTDFSQYPFYPANESTARLDLFARYAVRLERFKEAWVYNLMPSDDLSWIWEKEAFWWLHESSSIRWIAVLLARGDVDGVTRFADAFKMYHEGWASLSNKDLAKLHTMTACNLLWEEGRNRDEVTKQEIQLRAIRLWAGSVCRRKRLELTEVNISREEKNLPHVDWPLIRKELGLEDLKGSKPGRKAMGNKKG